MIYAKVQCVNCGELKAYLEPENAYSDSFWIYGCDCDTDDTYGYGATPEQAEANYKAGSPRSKTEGEPDPS